MRPNHRLRRHHVVLLLGCFAILAAAPAIAQIAHHPFAVGANEGAVGHQNALGAWLLSQESRFYLGLTSAVRETRTSASALLLLIGLSFAYGIFHAAGPGHGKAVITSYMLANEVALRRGMMLAFLAALLQAVVATALVGIAAFVFDATAPRMTQAAQAAELASYIGIVAMGLVLVWRKGRAFALLRPIQPKASLVLAASGPTQTRAPVAPGLSLRTMGTSTDRRFVADDGTGPEHASDCACGAHIPDPALLERDRLDLKVAGMAVLTAGARPCSGAILVLVFALSQGIFLAGIAATFAMAFGTAITTSALATTAVLAKGLAVRISRGGTGRAVFIGRLVELAAALCILVFGLALLAAALSGIHGAA